MTESTENKSYSFNWLSLLIKVIIFAVLLIIFIWIVSRFASKKCETIEEDYYVINTFTDNQYNARENDDVYTYTYTIKLLNIDTYNSQSVYITSSNYFHSSDEYDDYLTSSSNNFQIINQTSNAIAIDSVDDLMNSSLTPKEFDFDISDIYVFGDEYYIDITIYIDDHSDITPYLDNYFIPLHLTIEYTETDNCKIK